MERENQGEFVRVVTAALTDVVSKLPGFRGAEVLASANGIQVMVQIEWDSDEHVQQLEYVPELGSLLRDLRRVAHEDRNTYRVAAHIEG